MLIFVLCIVLYTCHTYITDTHALHVQRSAPSFLVWIYDILFAQPQSLQQEHQPFPLVSPFFPIPNRENHATVQNCRENDHIHIADATQYPRTDFLKVNLYNLEF